jgi:pilus assembly protein FimV
VAKVNPAKLKQDADKNEKAGRLEQAIELYRQVLTVNPQDWNTVNKVGDLYAKLNRNREASAEYAKVADYYARDGFLLKAIAIWKKINKLDATALEPYLNLADLYAKQGLMMEAKGQYQIIVDEYVRRGKLKDAGDVLGRMAEIDPSDLKIRSKLADLYTREGNAGKAVDEHIAIADELNKKGHLAEALQVLEKGLRIDGHNPRLRAEIARIHLLQKSFDKAVLHLEDAVQQSPKDTLLLTRLGEAYLGAKKIDEAQAIFLRLLELDPADQDARVQMGRLYIMQGQVDRALETLVPVVDRLVEQRDTDRAVGLLQQILQRSPDHAPSLVKIAEIQRASGNETQAAQTYSQLTDAYIKAGAFDQAASILDMLVATEPQNAQHRTKLDFVRQRQAGGAVSPAAQMSAPAPSRAATDSFDFDEEEFDLDQPLAQAGAASASVSAPAAVPTTTPAPRPSRPLIEASGPLTPEDKEFLDEHLAEGRVFRKYGLVDKALDQFEAVVARFPDQVDARKELIEIYKERDDGAKVTEHTLALIEIHKLQGNTSEASRLETEMSAAAPAPAAARPAPAPAPAPAAAEPPPTAEEPFSEEISIDIVPAEAPEPAAPVHSAGPPADDLSSLDFGLEGGEEEGIPDSFLDLDAAPSAPPAAASSPELDVPLDIESPAELEGIGADLGLGFGAEDVSGGIPDLDALAGGADEPSMPESAPGEIDVPFPGVEEQAPSPLSLDDDLLGSLPDVGAPTMAPEPEAPAPWEDETPGGLEDMLSGAGPQPAASPIAPDLQRTLADIDQSLTFGFIDEARSAIRLALRKYPDHAELLARAEQVGLSAVAGPADAEVGVGGLADLVGEPDADMEAMGLPAPEPEGDLLGDIGLPEPPSMDLGPAPAPEPEPEPLPVSGPSGDGFDLGSELGGLFSAQAAVEAPLEGPISPELDDAGLSEIFEEFKKGVDRQLGKEDYDTRYNLGIAYKEMGLVDEAVAEFQLAAKDESRVLECSSMLGLCFMEKGMPKLAMKWFERGLQAPGRLEEEYQGLRYDLAAAYEAAGDVNEAYRVLSELYTQNAGFRDVASKVVQLRASLGR